MTKFAPAALFALALLAGSAQAQDVRPSLAPGAAPAPATLADLKGLVGNWAGPLGVAGFTMTPDNQLIGHLEISTGTAARYDELWVFRPDGNSVSVSQKYFLADLSAPQEKDVWLRRRLVAVDAHAIHLENLTWLTEADTITLMLNVPGKDGAPATVSHNVMKRVR